MPAHPTYPGLYIEEVSSGVRTITGVSTSVTAFVGYTARGPLNEATQIFSFADFERKFGGLDGDSPLSYSVYQYFQNGGSEAWIVRVASGSVAASTRLRNAPSGASEEVLEITAASDGLWGNNLRLEVDYDTANPDGLFNLTVSEVGEQDGVLRALRSERLANLGMNPNASSYAVDVINAGSTLIRAELPGGVFPSAVSGLRGTSTSGTLPPSIALDDAHRRVAITVDGEESREFDLFETGAGGTFPLARVVDMLTAGVHRPEVMLGVSFSIVTDGSGSDVGITASSATTGETSEVSFSVASTRDATGLLKLGLAKGGTEVPAAAAIRPAATGTVGSALPDALTSIDRSGLRVTVSVGAGAGTPIELEDLWPATEAAPGTPEEARVRFQEALSRSADARLQGAAVSLLRGRLRVVAGGFDQDVSLRFDNTGVGLDPDHDLGLDAAEVNVARYALGSATDVHAQAGGLAGLDGLPPTAPGELSGAHADKTGLYALDDVDLFNLLCIPETAGLSESVARSVLAEAETYCEQRRAFLLVDLPDTTRTLDQARTWLTANATLRSRNAAAYFPQVRLNDPINAGRLRNHPPSGAVAGLYARTDTQRGVWKAPAGTDAALRGVAGLTVKLTDPENGALNPLGLNCLRTFPIYGSTAWGARTLKGADAMADEYKYVPVRRLALFLEESLYRGLKWVVFEPNDEPLWSSIRLNVGAFMNDLFRQGAFQGRTTREAYLVKCDRETTTQNDIDKGIVNVVVGFAPLKPAEFVFLKIQQLAGQIAT